MRKAGASAPASVSVRSAGDRVLIENREERDGFVGDEVAHMDGGDRFRIHARLPSHSVFGGVCCCQARCSFAAGKAIQQSHRTFRCGFGHDQQFPMSRGRLCSADPRQIILSQLFVVSVFRFSTIPRRDDVVRLCG